MGNASHVVSVDVSKTALDQGYQNAKLNHLEEKIDFVNAGGSKTIISNSFSFNSSK